MRKMKRRAMIASLMTLALLATPFGSMGAMGKVHAKEASESAAEKVQLDAPTNLRWGPRDSSHSSPNCKYDMNWEGVNPSLNDSGYDVTSGWDIEVYKDDELFDTTLLFDYYYESYWDMEANKNIFKDTPEGNHQMQIVSKISDSGSYKFRVRASAWWKDEAHQDSEWSQWSESITYIRPEQELGVVTNVSWDTKKAGVCCFSPLNDSEYLDGYYVYLHWMTKWDETWPESRYSMQWVSRYACQDVAVVKVDFSDAISDIGEAKYCVSVIAFSNDIDVVANGRESQKSDILDTIINAEKLSGILNGATDKTAVETTELLTDSADISAIQQAMQTDDTFRGQVQELEGRYAAEQGIKVESPAVSAAAEEYVNPRQVSVVGAAFNAAQGQAVNLQMDVTPEADRIPYSNKKNVQLDIKLVSDNTEIHNLSMPVSVTMPIPQGISATQLVLLHRRADGTMERTAFHVNNDGTITFTVSSFSTFIFAEESSENIPDEPAPVQPAPAPDQSGKDSGSDWWLEPLSSQIAAAAPGSTVRLTKEQNISTLSRDIMQMLVKRGDVALEMEYTYEGNDYHIFIPAGRAIDSDISWYGPLYLSAHFNAADNTAADNAAVIVRKGDTLSKIAGIYHTTVARLAAANPQIKNVNFIVPGQVINID